MEQVEQNQPVVSEVNEALAGLSTKQAAIEVEDEEEQKEGDKKKKAEADKMLPPASTPTPKPRKAPQVMIKNEEKGKPEVKAMPRKAEKETRYEDDENERKKARYESRPSRPEDGEMAPQKTFECSFESRDLELVGQGLKNSRVERIADE